MSTAWHVFATLLHVAFYALGHRPTLALLSLALLGLAIFRARRGHSLPRHRARSMRVRLHLRRKPGPGFASAAELWMRWGRVAAWREAARSRPTLAAQRGRWYLLLHPREHSLFIGRGHWRHGLRLPIQEHAAVVGPPRAFKSALLSKLILQAPGAVVSTSSKPDMYGLTSGVRSQRGPIFVFNPQGLGGVPSNVRWNPIVGCDRQATAIRIADGFANAVSTDGTEDGTFWATQASDHLRSLFTAAAIVRADMGLVSRWILGPSVADAVAILADAGYTQWAQSLAQLDGPADKTNATVRMVMRRALAYTGDPALLVSTSPGDGSNFDIDAFLRSGGTLYMIAKGDGKDATLGPLFAALASEIQFRATQIGSQNRNGARLDPPLHFILDEITQICPIPLPQWLADSGGQGVQIISAFHGVAQLMDRWGLAGAQIILDTSGCKIICPGLSNGETLRDLASLCGQHAFRSGDGEQHHDVITGEMIRRLPPKFALLVRGGNAPVAARLAAGWHDSLYRAAKRADSAVAAITAAEALPAGGAEDLVPAAVPVAPRRPVRETVPAGPDDTPWS
jgi:type IV secretion system protein VirD4